MQLLGWPVLQSMLTPSGVATGGVVISLLLAVPLATPLMDPSERVEGSTSKGNHVALLYCGG